MYLVESARCMVRVVDFRCHLVIGGRSERISVFIFLDSIRDTLVDFRPLLIGTVVVYQKHAPQGKSQKP